MAGVKLQAAFRKAFDGSAYSPFARWAAWALIGVTAALLFVRYPANPMGSAAPSDFTLHLRASARMAAGENPYAMAVSRAGGPDEGAAIRTVPGVLAAFGWLPAGQSTAWSIFTVLSILGLSIGLLVGSRYRSWRHVLMLALGLGLAWKGILETLDLGQLELFLFGLAVLSAAMLVRRPALSGFLAGTLPAFKLPWVAVILPLVLVFARGTELPGPPSGNAGMNEGGPARRRRKFQLLISSYLMAWFIWGAAVPSLVFGPERSLALSQAWYEALKAQPPEVYLSDMNQSLWLSALRWAGGGHGELAAGLAACVSGLLLACFFTRRLRILSFQETLGWISAWLMFIYLLNPLAWRWGSVFAVGIPLGSITGSIEGRFVRQVLWACVGLLWLAQLSPVTSLFGFEHWTQLHSTGVITAQWLALVLLAM